MFKFLHYIKVNFWYYMAGYESMASEAEIVAFSPITIKLTNIVQLYE